MVSRFRPLPPDDTPPVPDTSRPPDPRDIAGDDPAGGDIPGGPRDVAVDDT